MKIWLDDIRPMPQGFDIWCKNHWEVIDALNTKSISHISFDHDLGKDSMDGYWIACVIENGAYKGLCHRITWDIHSANPSGRHNIELAMNSAERFWNQCQL